MRHDVKGPYAHSLKISDEQVKDFTGKTVMMFYQVNLLRDVFEQRDILGEGVVSSYEGWAKTILRPWINDDEDIRNSWSLMLESRDLLGGEFLEWLTGHIVIGLPEKKSKEKSD